MHSAWERSQSNKGDKNTGVSEYFAVYMKDIKRISCLNQLTTRYLQV